MPSSLYSGGARTGRNGRGGRGEENEVSTVTSQRIRGPAWLFAAWVVHDVEEAIAVPRACEYLARRTGLGALRRTARQSRAAVGVVGVRIGVACVRGVSAGGTPPP